MLGLEKQPGPIGVNPACLRFSVKATRDSEALQREWQFLLTLWPAGGGIRLFPPRSVLSRSRPRCSRLTPPRERLCRRLMRANSVRHTSGGVPALAYPRFKEAFAPALPRSSAAFWRTLVPACRAAPLPFAHGAAPIAQLTRMPNSRAIATLFPLAAGLPTFAVM